MKTIPYGHQNINKDDIQAVVDVLKSDFITQGPVGPAFETAVASYCGAKHGVAVNSATSALHIACKSLGLGADDYLWTSPNTFVASANCALFCGAKVDFVDIDPQTYNMSVSALRDKLKKAEKTGSLPKIVIPVHFSGQSCEMKEIAELSQKYGFSVIEDASHAIGGRYQQDKIGCCTYSDMTIFSLHPVKIITTGEGGMILTQKNGLYEKLLLLRNHGITRDPLQMTEKSHGPWYYQQIDLGYNFRMTDLQAALGYSQLQRLDEFVSKRHALAARYNDAIEYSPLTLPWQHPETYSAWHLYVIRLKSELAKYRLEIYQYMQCNGIGVNVHYIPIHLQPYYKSLGFQSGDYPVAERFYAEAITIPLFHGMSFSDQDKVINALATALDKHT